MDDTTAKNTQTNSQQSPDNTTPSPGSTKSASDELTEISKIIGQDTQPPTQTPNTVQPKVAPAQQTPTVPAPSMPTVAPAKFDMTTAAASPPDENQMKSATDPLPKDNPPVMSAPTQDLASPLMQDATMQPTIATSTVNANSPSPIASEQTQTPITPASPDPTHTAPEEPPAGPDTPPPQSQNPSEVLTTQSKKSRFGLFIGVLVVITIAIYAGVTYLYISNKNMDNPQSTSNQIALQNTSPTPTPTPSFSPDQIKLINGSVYNALPSGENLLLVNKENFDATGITGFAKVAVSPDNQKICLESWPPSPQPALYLANIDGSDAKEVATKKKNCTWLSSSQSLLYVDALSDDSPINIYTYSLSSGEEVSLTSDLAATGATRYYELSGLNSDGSAVICRYDEQSATASAQATEGHCEINYATGKYSELTVNQ